MNIDIDKLKVMNIGKEESWETPSLRKYRSVKILGKSADKRSLLHKWNLITDCHDQFRIHQKDITEYQQLEFGFGEGIDKMLYLKHCSMWSETWTLRKLEKKCSEGFKMWCWWRIIKVYGHGGKWRGSNESRLEEVDPKQSSSEVSNWIGHILRRNCLLHEVIEETLEGSLGVRRKLHLLDVSIKSDQAKFDKFGQVWPGLSTLMQWRYKRRNSW